jgi:dUTP pyrophosphatase
MPRVNEDDQSSNLLIQQLSENSTIPTRATSDSIRYDLYSSSTSEITIPAGGIIPIPTGIAIQCPTGTYIRIVPRSGLCIKRYITTEAGVIDPDYRGNVIVLLRNFGTEDQIIQPKERIAQLILENATMAETKIVDTLTTTDRNDIGFGSTGTTLLNNAANPMKTSTPLMQNASPSATKQKLPIINLDDEPSTSLQLPKMKETEFQNNQHGSNNIDIQNILDRPTTAMAAKLFSDIQTIFDVPYHLQN